MNLLKTCAGMSDDASVPAGGMFVAIPQAYRTALAHVEAARCQNTKPASAYYAALEAGFSAVYSSRSRMLSSVPVASGESQKVRTSFTTAHRSVSRGSRGHRRNGLRASMLSVWSFSKRFDAVI